MSGNIQGSSLNTVSLDSVTATQALSPTGGAVVKASTAFTNAGAVTGSPYNDYTSISGLWGASWNGAVVWTPSGSGSTGGSYNIAAVTLANNLTGNEKVAVFWGSDYCYDATLSSVSGAGFTITFPNGQTALPATGTSLTIAVNMDYSFVVNGSLLDQLIMTSTQPGIISLFATSTNELNEVLTAGGNFYGWATGSGVSNPISGYSITKVRFYNNSTTTAVASAVALID